MFDFLPGMPGLDNLRSLGRKVDTARHHGVPDGCVLELDLRQVPPETGGFDPFAVITGGGGHWCCAKPSPRSTAQPRTRGWTG